MGPAEELARDGAVLMPQLIAERLAAWEAAAAPFIDAARPGTRIAGSSALSALIGEVVHHARLAAIIGKGWNCVRAIAFDKSPEKNWALGWHQDRTIAVARRIDLPGFEIWTSKAGVPHVEPPFTLLARMVTLRLHLDPVTADNAPLLVARGSHLRGRVAVGDIASVVTSSEVLECRAKAGDAWLYVTPVLHASQRSRSLARRRVLQLDFAREGLPGGLEWAGIS